MEKKNDILTYAKKFFKVQLRWAIKKNQVRASDSYAAAPVQALHNTKNLDLYRQGN